MAPAREGEHGLALGGQLDADHSILVAFDVERRSIVTPSFDQTATLCDADMPTLAIVAYPVLAADDHRWIEAIRARHDPQAGRIAAHVTLLFPWEGELAALAAHAVAT